MKRSSPQEPIGERTVPGLEARCPTGFTPAGAGTIPKRDFPTRPEAVWRFATSSLPAYRRLGGQRIHSLVCFLPLEALESSKSTSRCESEPARGSDFSPRRSQRIQDA